MDYTLIGLYLGFVIPVIASLLVWGSKINSKLAVICINHANLVEAMKTHNLEAKVSEKELESLNLRVALLERDINEIKAKLSNN